MMILGELLILNKCCSIGLSIQQRILEKCTMVSTKLSSTTVLFKWTNYNKNTCFMSINILEQWFSNLSCKHPCPAHVVCLPYQTHLIQLISSVVETARPELGVSHKGAWCLCLQDRFENHWIIMISEKMSVLIAVLTITQECGIKFYVKWKQCDIRLSMVTHSLNSWSEFTHPKCTHTVVNTHLEQWAAIYVAAPIGAVGGSVPCSRAPQSWYWGWREHCTFTPPTYNSRRPETQTFDYESDSLAHDFHVCHLCHAMYVTMTQLS